MAPRLRNVPKESTIIPLLCSNALCAGCGLSTSHAYRCKFCAAAIHIFCSIDPEELGHGAHYTCPKCYAAMEEHVMTLKDVSSQDSCSDDPPSKANAAGRTRDITDPTVAATSIDEAPSQANAVGTLRDIADRTAVVTSIHDIYSSCIARNCLPRGIYK
jgi:hypothetical protein